MLLTVYRTQKLIENSLGGCRQCSEKSRRRGRSQIDNPESFSDLLAAASARLSMSERPLGKRQPRPNLSRSDFGYEERARAAGPKGAKKQKRDDEEDGMPMPGGAGGEPSRPPMRGEKDARNLTVDFTKLDMATLKRYKRHYRLKTRQNVTKTELALAVAKHFALQTVDEADTISLFMYSARAGSLQYDRRDYLNGR